MALVYVTRPSVLPIALADAKAHLRVDFPDDDSYITGLIWTALDYAENFCHRAIMPQTLMLVMDHFPGVAEHYQAYTDLGVMGDAALGLGVPPVGYTYRFQSEVYFRAGAIILPRPHLQTVDSIRYLDAYSQTQQVLDPSKYVVDTASEPARVAPAPNLNWPLTLISTRAPVLNAVQIQYEAGYTPMLFQADGTTPDVASMQAALPWTLKHAMKLLLTHFYESRAPVLAGPRVDAVEVPLSVEALLYRSKIIYQ